ncbi:MAG: hypothetical protein U0T81_14375 [Saprospiraceae bacterium]
MGSSILSDYYQSQTSKVQKTIFSIIKANQMRNKDEFHASSEEEKIIVYKGTEYPLPESM